ncbi:hypothetical protein E2C01_028401 [Portunus trituberculatus]|uniref:Uncharacterized protein n=1 Tax=Portunus trituberculatus TaxID=210409 RepID=A0A5B7ERK5_PORTR|nr:hypothetical protein [Portunus trituberculatus]
MDRLDRTNTEVMGSWGGICCVLLVCDGLCWSVLEPPSPLHGAVGVPPSLRAAVGVPPNSHGGNGRASQPPCGSGCASQPLWGSGCASQPLWGSGCASQPLWGSGCASQPLWGSGCASQPLWGSGCASQPLWVAAQCWEQSCTRHSKNFDRIFDTFIVNICWTRAWRVNGGGWRPGRREVESLNNWVVLAKLQPEPHHPHSMPGVRSLASHSALFP